MPKKLKIKAADLGTLRDFLMGADVDFGCRPVARRAPEGFYTIALADDVQLGRLNARRSGGVEIEVIEELPDPRTQRRMVSQRNRFLRGEVPRGLGKKE